jgi:hypothetical protein
VWSSVNGAVNGLFDVLLWPFHSLPVFWQILALAVPATAVALLAFRFTSNQAGITRAKSLIKAHLLELRLFKDDFRVILAAQGAILRYTLRYMKYGLTPMLVMIVPFLIILIQVESRFAFRPLHPGEPAILAVKVDTAAPVSRLPASLGLPDGLTSETPPLRLDASAEIYWRIKGKGPGRYPVEISVGDDAVTKHVIVGYANTSISPFLYQSDDWRVLAWPAERPMKAEAFAEAIRLDYPRGRAEFAGLSSASWLLFGMCIILGFLFRGLFGVTF